MVTPVLFSTSKMSTNDSTKYHRISVALPIEQKETLLANLELAGFKGATDVFHMITNALPEELEQLRAIGQSAKSRIASTKTSKATLKETLRSMTPEEIARFIELAKAQ